jgi:hypothetical protein
MKRRFVVGYKQGSYEVYDMHAEEGKQIVGIYSKELDAVYASTGKEIEYLHRVISKLSDKTDDK